MATSQTASRNHGSIRERWLELSHGRSRCLTAGEGPPVILLHGAGFSSGAESWARNIEALAAGATVVAPDFVGWGPGDDLSQGYSFAYLVDFVREVQDSLGFRVTDVVGHSMGGWVGALLAYESPARVGRLALVAGGGLATRTLTSMTAWSPPDRDTLNTHYTLLFDEPSEVERAVEARLALGADQRRIEQFGRVMDHMTDAETRERYNLRRRLPQIEAETLVLWGSADAVNPLELGQEAVALIPRSRLVVAKGAGHGLPVERPAWFNQQLAEFLRHG